MIVAFKLSMPRCGSWNNKWTDSDKEYIITRTMTKAKAEEIHEQRCYSYNFGDGWVANVVAGIVNSKLAAKLRRKSAGFCNYDWMVDSIVVHGEIRSSK